MRRCALALAAALAASCGGDSGPSTIPAPPPRVAPPISLAWANVPGQLSLRVGNTHNIRLNLTATISARFQVESDNSRVSVTNALLYGGVFTATIRGLSAGPDTVRLTVTAQGYETAQTSFSVTVERRTTPPSPPDPIPNDPRFQHTFWRAMVFDAHECPRAGTRKSGAASYPSVENRGVAVLSTTSPSFHIRTHDDVGNRTFSSSEIEALRREIPRAVEALTEVRFRGQILWNESAFERAGWISITQVRNLGGDVCGRAYIGASPGAIELVADVGCPLGPLITHEIGHAMGFFHVSSPSDVMYPTIGSRASFSNRETYHARLAYQLGRGHPYTDGSLTAEQRRGPGEAEPPEQVIVCRSR
ncbi:MAG: matrixin family metalloprotease [Chloroflexi bacterium]|nr:matrixin family metalloprotease [Chloroflexota bacterium]